MTGVAERAHSAVTLRLTGPRTGRASEQTLDSSMDCALRLTHQGLICILKRKWVFKLYSVQSNTVIHKDSSYREMTSVTVRVNKNVVQTKESQKPKFNSNNALFLMQPCFLYIQFSNMH
ncbi:Solute Carrier Family 35 Member F2 [Manis pentadactyla]|nr:Solute Carrier Family 35 Member F2 [Manis pentadactyla]